MMEASSAVAATLASSPWSDGGRSTTRGDRGSTGMGPAGWTSSPPATGMAATDGRRERVAESIGIGSESESESDSECSSQGSIGRLDGHGRGDGEEEVGPVAVSVRFLSGINLCWRTPANPRAGCSDRGVGGGACSRGMQHTRVDERGLAGFRLGRQREGLKPERTARAVRILSVLEGWQRQRMRREKKGCKAGPADGLAPLVGG